MRRIRGLFIITRTLLPFLLVIGLIAATWITARSLVRATQTYGEGLGVQLQEIQRAVDEANDGLEAVGSFVSSTTRAAESLLDRVTGLTDSLSIPLPEIEIPAFTVLDRIVDIPDFRLGDGVLDIPLPGIEPLQTMAGDLVEAGRRVTEPITKMAALADVPPHLEQAAEETVAYAANLRSAIWGWLGAMMVLLVAGALVWLIAAIAPVVSELRRGWSMVVGRSPIERGVTDLAVRVAELERRLAAMA